ncbi:fibroblast growth factor-binding protein 1 isoform X1 [Eleutherodactylus coqui]|uniref:fibroblast growth factor-binding protein 1 isoform X1 n=2 Tax=Eleutherodactylus coqui TaxID=57060 RepID=UPI003461CA52
MKDVLAVTAKQHIMKLKTFALLTAVTLLLSQILLVEGNKQKEGKKDRQKGAGKEEKQKSPTQNKEKERGSKGGRASLKGKFLSKDKAECIWSVSGTETVTLNVECTKGDTKVSCAYGGNPTGCPNYAANQKSYWKQITRALKKKNICQDQKAVLKSKECKNGPPEAHLRYLPSNVPVPNHGSKIHEQPKPTTKVNITEPNKDCEKDTDVEREKLAKEYCGGSWSSLCSFFFSMVQDKSC